jgi:hypothetical protein
VMSTSAGDQTYLNADATLADWAQRRDALAARINALLDWTGPSTAEGDDHDAETLAKQARALLREVHGAAA